ncbi:MAG: NADH-ubiquinone/plastoquinone oxidoreductase subunit 6 [Acidobacteria bacterium]|nr:MAG: NADH-ubiquinone/plastoquinone oxidoreductase subunit 6 [Acidobacteriota bacterium]
MLDQAIFYLFAGVAVVSAILTVTRRNAVHSAIFLITALLATAGIFLELRAEFLFIVQIILYVGGIMVLFVFVIMSRKIPGQGVPVLNAVPADKLPPNSEEVAKSLFSSYLLPFEIASVLLLVAMIGAVVMAKKRT